MGDLVTPLEPASPIRVEASTPRNSEAERLEAEKRRISDPVSFCGDSTASGVPDIPTVNRESAVIDNGDTASVDKDGTLVFNGAENVCGEMTVDPTRKESDTRRRLLDAPTVGIGSAVFLLAGYFVYTFHRRWTAKKPQEEDSMV